MDFKRISLGTIVGFLSTFLLGYLIYGVLGGVEQLQGGNQAGVRTQPSMGAIVLIEVATALLITLIYHQCTGIKTFATGAKHGLWIGLLLGIIVQADFYAMTTTTTESGVAFYAITHAIRTAITGGLIGWVLGKLDNN